MCRPDPQTLSLSCRPQDARVSIRGNSCTVRLRTDAAKRFKKVQNATAMIWKLLGVAEKRFRRLKGYWLLRDVYERKHFTDGIAVEQEGSEERIAA